MIELWFLLALFGGLGVSIVGALDKFVLKNKGIEPFSLSPLRYFLNFLTLFIISIYLYGFAFPFDIQFVKFVIFLGIFWSIAGLGYFYGVKHEDISRVIPYYRSLQIAIPFILAVLILSESPTIFDSVGMISIAIGSYILLTEGRFIWPSLGKGMLLITMAGIAMAVVALIVKVSTLSYSPFFLILYMYLTVSILLASFNLIRTPKEQISTVKKVLKNRKILGIVLITSIIAPLSNFAFFKAISLHTVSEVYPIFASDILLIVLIGRFGLMEKKNILIRFLSAILIFAGMYGIYI